VLPLPDFSLDVSHDPSVLYGEVGDFFEFSDEGDVSVAREAILEQSDLEQNELVDVDRRTNKRIDFVRQIQIS
jgi:hypothetical protein